MLEHLGLNKFQRMLGKPMNFMAIFHKKKKKLKIDSRNVYGIIKLV